MTVATNYRGATAEIIESQVTKIIENSLAGIEGVEYMTSISRAEQSQITVRFRINRDVDAAANDVRDRVARVRGNLPDDIDEPVVSKVEADAEPILYLAFSSTAIPTSRSPTSPTAWCRTGCRRCPASPTCRSTASGAIPCASGSTATSSPPTADHAGRRGRAAPRRTSRSRPAASRATREFTVVSADRSADARASSTTSSSRTPAAIWCACSDVARVEIGAEDDRIIARYNGKSAVALGVVKQSVANPLDVSKAVRAAIPEIEAQLPPGHASSTSPTIRPIFIDRSIDAVYHTIGEAVLLVVGVIFLFLRSLRATLVPLVTIPVSLIGTFALMLRVRLLDQYLTLLAFVLAIGLVVDDAIVVLENIYRHIEDGMPPLAPPSRACARSASPWWR